MPRRIVRAALALSIVTGGWAVPAGAVAAPLEAPCGGPEARHLLCPNLRIGPPSEIYEDGFDGTVRLYATGLVDLQRIGGGIDDQGACVARRDKELLVGESELYALAEVAEDLVPAAHWKRIGEDANSCVRGREAALGMVIEQKGEAHELQIPRGQKSRA